MRTNRPRPTYRAPVKQRLIMLPIIIWMLVGILQTAGDMSGFRFLSSSDWFDRSAMWSWIAAAVLAPLSAWCVLVGIRAQDITKGKTRSPASVRLHLLSGLLVGAGLGGESVSSGVPMVIAYDMNPVAHADGLKLNITDADNALDLELAREVAAYFRLNLQEADATIEEFRSIVGQWRVVAQQVGLSASEQDRMAGAFRLADSDAASP